MPCRHSCTWAATCGDRPREGFRFYSLIRSLREFTAAPCATHSMHAPFRGSFDGHPVANLAWGVWIWASSFHTSQGMTAA